MSGREEALGWVGWCLFPSRLGSGLPLWHPHPYLVVRKLSLAASSPLTLPPVRGCSVAAHLLLGLQFSGCQPITASRDLLGLAVRGRQSIIVSQIFFLPGLQCSGRQPITADTAIQ